MVHSTTKNHNNSTYHHTVLLAIDNKNSVLAEVVADKTNHIAYSAYGHQSAQQEVMTRLGFNGELREMQTSWYLLGNGYRAYNPRLMRFNSPDNLSPFGAGGFNAYIYCGGNPVMNKDPTGHAFFSFLRTGLNNLIDRNNVFFSTYRAQIAAGQNPVSALTSSVNVNRGVLNTLGASKPNGFSKPGAAPSNNPFTAKDGWSHSKVVGGSSTPAPDASYLPGPDSNSSGNGWDRLAAKTQSGSSQNATPRSSTSGGDNPNLNISQRKSYPQVPTTTGHPSSYFPGMGASRRDPPILKSSSSPYPTTLVVESSNVRRKD